MKNQKKTEIKVGITVVVGVLVFLWIFGWAKNYNINSNRKEMTIEFNSVAGLEVGDAATINGVRKGFVDDIEVKGNKVIVKVNLDNDVKLMKDATFSILMLDLMGGKKIEINPGISNTPIDFAQVQQGKFSGDISTAMAALSSVQEDLVSVIKEVKISLKNMNGLFANSTFTDEIQTSVKNLNDLTSKLNIVLTENRDNLKSLIEQGENVSRNVNEMLKDNRDAIKETLRNAQNVVANTDTLVKRINSFTAETKGQNNNLGKLLYDKNLMTKLNKSMEQINELTKILVKQLKGDGVNVDANISIF
ncbi:mce related protein [bacterium BMS3Abin04]|nr:mce related protein [bacterium BMS3Abin04]